MSRRAIWLVFESLDGSFGTGDVVVQDAGWFPTREAADAWIEANPHGALGSMSSDSVKAATVGAKNEPSYGHPPGPEEQA